MLPAEGTKSRALREARDLLQSYGFNGFSFQHVADAVGIRQPSLYDHFPSKAALARQLIDGYSRAFAEWTRTIAAFAAPDRIGAWFESFHGFADDGRKLCPLAAFAADYNSLPPALRRPLLKLCREERAWLRSVVRDGQRQGSFRRDRSADALAALLLSVGLGAQLTARVSNRAAEIRSLKRQILKLLEPVSVI